MQRSLSIPMQDHLVPVLCRRWFRYVATKRTRTKAEAARLRQSAKDAEAARRRQAAAAYLAEYWQSVFEGPPAQDGKKCKCGRPLPGSFKRCKRCAKKQRRRTGSTSPEAARSIAIYPP